MVRQLSKSSLEGTTNKPTRLVQIAEIQNNEDDNEEEESEQEEAKEEYLDDDVAKDSELKLYRDYLLQQEKLSAENLRKELDLGSNVPSEEIEKLREAIMKAEDDDTREQPTGADYDRMQTRKIELADKNEIDSSALESNIGSGIDITSPDEDQEITSPFSKAKTIHKKQGGQ
mmetsp:Transcript_33673/g.52004  ORF Transcript_33673/g.52004 Transcript_33673/m.52004 type:complete len:173 (+) Transcript_33673:3119-3637(+)